ncbi:MAG: neutral/alkaline non-lysosomal ceramidase N-terminal domain-containing protein [Pirellulales bacterium]|nr:neutral/alkaline non-lysosomal ceramidase N-terminal domain-containing protein [Pirellulales bacterium]
MYRVILLAIGLLFVPMNSQGAVQGESSGKKTLLAGAVTSNVTPQLGLPVIGGFKPFPATHVHDELFARCIVLDDGSQRIAVVIVDILGIPREVTDLARLQIEKATGIKFGHVLIAATHTHSAVTPRGPRGVFWPDEISDHSKFVARRIADGVQRAVNQLEPAQIGWGRTTLPGQVFNRRWHCNDSGVTANPFGGIDQVRMNPPRNHPSLDRPAGPTDPEIRFLSIQSTSGRPIAVLSNYSLHYVGGVSRGHISADYYGYFARYLEQKIGAQQLEPAFVATMSNGTSGDINNINFRPNPGGKRYAPYEKMQEVAEKAASKVAEAYQDVKYKKWVPVGARQNDMVLKLRQPSEEMLKHLREVVKLPADKFQSHKQEKVYAERIFKLADAPSEVEISLQTLKIGETGIAAIPFETFAETGLEIKRESPFKNTFTIELANGWYGYLPTPRQHRLGGYETWLGTNWVEVEASDKITAQLLRMFESLAR